MDPDKGGEGGSLYEVPTGFIGVEGVRERRAMNTVVQCFLSKGWYQGWNNETTNAGTEGGEFKGRYKGDYNQWGRTKGRIQS